MRVAHRLKGEKVKEIINNKGDDCPVVINVKCFREWKWPGEIPEGFLEEVIFKQGPEEWVEADQAA